MGYVPDRKADRAIDVAGADMASAINTNGGFTFKADGSPMTSESGLAVVGINGLGKDDGSMPAKGSEAADFIRTRRDEFNSGVARGVGGWDAGDHSAYDVVQAYPGDGAEARRAGVVNKQDAIGYIHPDGSYEGTQTTPNTWGGLGIPNINAMKSYRDNKTLDG